MNSAFWLSPPQQHRRMMTHSWKETRGHPIPLSGDQILQTTGSTYLPHLHPEKRWTPITARARASTNLSPDHLMFTSRNDRQRTPCCARGFLWAWSLQLTQPPSAHSPVCVDKRGLGRDAGRVEGQAAVSE